MKTKLKKLLLLLVIGWSPLFGDWSWTTGEDLRDISDNAWQGAWQTPTEDDYLLDAEIELDIVADHGVFFSCENYGVGRQSIDNWEYENGAVGFFFDVTFEDKSWAKLSYSQLFVFENDLGSSTWLNATAVD